MCVHVFAYVRAQNFPVRFSGSKGLMKFVQVCELFEGLDVHFWDRGP